MGAEGLEGEYEDWRPPRAAAARWAKGVGVLLVVGLAALGALHLSGHANKPVSAAQVNELRLSGMRALRGNAPAPARPALGFVLDRTTAADVHAWAARFNVDCEARGHVLGTLHCGPVLRTSLPGGDPAIDAGEGRPPLIEDLGFTFDPAGRLVSVDAFTRGLEPATAAAAFAASDRHLARVLGPPADRGDEPTSAALARAPLASTTMNRYRFSDYVAILSVSALGSGMAVRELYLSGS